MLRRLYFYVPDFLLVGAVEEVLLGAPLAQHELQRRLAHGVGHAGEEGEDGLHL